MAAWTTLDSGMYDTRLSQIVGPEPSNGPSFGLISEQTTRWPNTGTPTINEIQNPRARPIHEDRALNQRLQNFESSGESFEVDKSSIRVTDGHVR